MTRSSRSRLLRQADMGTLKVENEARFGQQRGRKVPVAIDVYVNVMYGSGTPLGLADPRAAFR
jgi:hypothetical protein